MPVRHHRAAVGEQRVVGMHHALRHAGRAGREGEVDDLVRIEIGLGQRCPARLPIAGNCAQSPARARVRTDRRQAVDALHRRQRFRRRKHVRAVGVRTVARLREQHRGLDALEQLRRFRRPCSSDAATDCRRSRCASRRGTRRPPRRGWAATPTRARRASRPPRADPPPARRPTASSCAPRERAGCRATLHAAHARVLAQRCTACRAPQPA